MNFDVRSTSDGLWTVYNHRDEPVFTGTKSQCEDWLDAQENAARRNNRLSVLGRIAAWIARLGRRSGDSHDA